VSTGLMIGEAKEHDVLPWGEYALTFRRIFAIFKLV